MNGELPFVAVIIDGAPTASADRFELRVYEPGTEIASATPLFAASGDAGGQIQIRSLGILFAILELHFGNSMQEGYKLARKVVRNAASHDFLT
jgi:hypothetical protein